MADARSGARAVCPGLVLTRSGPRRAPSGGRRPGASGSRPAVRRGARRRPAAVREVSSGSRPGRRPASGVGRRGRAPEKATDEVVDGAEEDEDVEDLDAVADEL